MGAGRNALRRTLRAEGCQLPTVVVVTVHRMQQAPRPELPPAPAPACLPYAAKLSAGKLVGRQVRVLWPDDAAWYLGTVTHYNEHTGEHTVRLLPLLLSCGHSTVAAQLPPG